MKTRRLHLNYILLSWGLIGIMTFSFLFPAGYSTAGEVATILQGGNQIGVTRQVEYGDVIYIFITGDANLFIEFSIRDPSGVLYRQCSLTSSYKEPYTLVFVADSSGTYTITMKSKWSNTAQSILYDIVVLPFGQFRRQSTDIDQAQNQSINLINTNVIELKEDMDDTNEAQNSSNYQSFIQIVTNMDNINFEQNKSIEKNFKQLSTNLDNIDTTQNQTISQEIAQLKRDIDNNNQQMDTKFTSRADETNKDISKAMNGLYTALGLAIVSMIALIIIYASMSKKIRALEQKQISLQLPFQTPLSSSVPVPIPNIHSPTPIPQSFKPEDRQKQNPILPSNPAYCINCNKPMPSNVRFCPFCGAQK